MTARWRDTQGEVSSPRTVNVFTNPEAPWTPCRRHDRSLTPFPVLCPSQKNWKAGLKIPSLLFLVTRPHPKAIQEPTQSHPIRRKDTPIAQEIIRLSGGLCQEPGQRPMCIFYDPTVRKKEGHREKQVSSFNLFLSTNNFFPGTRSPWKASCQNRDFWEKLACNIILSATWTNVRA